MFYSIWLSNANTYRHFTEELGHPPDLDSFQDLSRYDDILLRFRRANPKQKIYGGHSQNVPPVTIFGFSKLTALNHLRLLRVMTDVNLGQRLVDCEYLEDAATTLKTIPTMGPYIGLCALLNLSQCDLFSWKEGGWASAGPGTVNTLKYIFGDGMSDYGQNFDLQVAGMQWIRNNQDLYWDKLGIAKEDQPQCPVGASNFKWDIHGYAAPVSKGGKALRVLDIENGACHFKRYRDRRAAGRIVWPSDRQDVPHQEFSLKADDDGDASDSDAEAYGTPVGDADADMDSERHRSDNTAIKAEDGELDAAELSRRLLSSSPSSNSESKSSSSASPSTSGTDQSLALASTSSNSSTASSPLTSRASTPDYRDPGTYEVEKIVDKKNNLFRIRWKGWAPEWDEWFTERDLADCPDILDEYDEFQYTVKAAIRRLQEEAKATRRQRREQGREITLVQVPRPRKRVTPNLKRSRTRSSSPTSLELDEETKLILESIPSVPGGIRRLPIPLVKEEPDIEIIDLVSSDEEEDVKPRISQHTTRRDAPLNKTRATTLTRSTRR